MNANFVSEFSRNTKEKVPEEKTSEGYEQELQRLLIIGKERGYITFDELNDALPKEKFSSEEIDIAISGIADMEIQLVETEDVETLSKGNVISTEVVSETNDNLLRTDDPVRMYLREMGNVELLSRDGEIELAKRIERGYLDMLSGLCESPKTFERLNLWKCNLQDRKIMLRDIIQLDVGTTDKGFENEDDLISEDDDIHNSDEELLENSTETNADEESALTETLALLEKAVDLHRQILLQKNADCSVLKKELVSAIKDLNINQKSVNSICEELYVLNRKLLKNEAYLLKLAQDSGINREEFLKRYYRNEISESWRTIQFKSPNWKRFFDTHLDDIETHRNLVTQIEEEIQLPLH